MASLVEILNKAFKALEQGHEVIIYKANNYFEISFINSGKINNSTEFKVLMKNTKTKQTKMGRFDRLSPQGAVNFISDFIKKSQKTQDKSPLSFMDSVVRAFKDRVEILGTKNPLNKSYYQGKITYELIGKGKRIIKFVTTANNESDFKRQAEIHLQHKHQQGEYKLLSITEIKKASISPKRREIIEK